MAAPFTCEVRVPWGDVDLSTTIYYPRVFHYFETAIEEFFRARSIEYGSFAEDAGVVLPRVAAHIDYKAPIRFHDLLQISVEIARVGNRSVTFGCEARCEGRTVARGTSTGVAIDPVQRRSVELPPKLRTILESARGASSGDSGPPQRPLLDAPANGHRWTARVHAGDVDLARTIYYPTLFHFFEQSIEELFRAANTPYRENAKDPGSLRRMLDPTLVFPRVSVRGEFLAPIRVGDLLTFTVGVPRIGNRSVTFASRAVKEDGRVAARAEVTAVTVDKAKWVAVPVPEGFKERIKPFT